MRIGGGSFFGAGDPCFIAAEIGINHNGDLQLAFDMIDAAAQAGADAVKFQNYRTEDFLSDRSLTYEYVSQGRPVTEPQYDMFKRCELSVEHLGRLKTRAEERGLIFFTTPTGADGVADAVRAGALLLKNGSDCLGHLPLIEAMGGTGLPTVLSTGMAKVAEIDDAIAAFRRGGGRDVVLLHCVSAYPTPDAEVNLRKIPVLAELFGVPVGLSDHSEGTVAALGAVALGACMIEKHFTTSRDLPGPDQRFSSDPAEFAELVGAVRRLEAMKGRAAIGPAAAEAQARDGYRLSCVAAAPIAAGTPLGAAHIAFRRPGNGIPPKEIGRLTGRVLARDVVRGHVFASADFA
jgi:N-acetylneuraminate synthase/N,N'-diacetyllegionaminate synthase